MTASGKRQAPSDRPPINCPSKKDRGPKAPETTLKISGQRMAGSKTREEQVTTMLMMTPSTTTTSQVRIKEPDRNPAEAAPSETRTKRINLSPRAASRSPKRTRMTIDMRAIMPLIRGIIGNSLKKEAILEIGEIETAAMNRIIHLKMVRHKMKMERNKWKTSGRRWNLQLPKSMAVRL